MREVPAAGDPLAVEGPVEVGKTKHPAAWSRPLRRFFRPFLTRTQKTEIRKRIADAESRTSAKIEILILARAGKKGILDQAKKHFKKLRLGPHEVLIVISHLDHQLAIWAGEQLHVRCGEQPWLHVRDTMTAHFSQRRYAEGICAGIDEIGNALAQHFPLSE